MTVLTRSAPATVFETDDHDVAGVALARETVTSWLDRHDATDDLRDTFELIASELVTNAMRNTTGVVRVAIGEVDGGFELEVFDESVLLPSPRTAGEGDTSGRGLALVAALADAWGAHEVVRDGLVGKVVWASCKAR